MWLSTLVDDLVAAGCQVRAQPGWEQRSSHSDGMWTVAGVVWHHTASPVSWDPHRDLDYVTFTGPYHPEYHIYISRAGSVHVICAGRAIHAGKGGPIDLPTGTVAAGHGNPNLIGVCFASTGTGETYPTAQIEAGLRVAVALSQRHGLDPGCHIAHREWAPGRKIDPAGPWAHDPDGWVSMDRWRALIADRLNPPPSQEDDDMARPYTAVRPINGYPVVILAPEGAFYVLEPKRVDDLVAAKLVNGIEPGQAYDAHANRLDWDTFAWRYNAILQRDRGRPLDAGDRRPAGEV